MIESFRHKGLRRLYEDEDRRSLPQNMIERLRVLLAALDAAKDDRGVAATELQVACAQGDLKGYWAMTVRANWRIVFRFQDGRVSDVDFLDYH